MGLFLYILAITLIVLLLISAYIIWVQNYWKRKGVPHIKPKFPFGNIQNPFTRKIPFAFVVKGLYDEMKRRGYRFGGASTLTIPAFIPIDLDIVRSILLKNFHNFSERGFYYNVESEPLDGHLFFIGGKKWRELRVKLTPTFTSGKMKMMFDTLLDCGQPFVKSLAACADEAKPVEVKDALGRFTTDVIGSCAFGLDCNSFEHEDSEFRKFGRKVFEVNPTRMAKLIFAFSFPKVAKKLGISITDQDVSSFFMKVVKDTVEFREKSKFTRNDFMQLLINIRDAHGSNFSTDEVAAQAFVFFLAGFETSSTAMSFSLYELAVNKDVQTKLREEIDEVLKRHDSKFTYEAIQEMKYLGQVLDEALRKYPPLGVLTRDCTQDCYIEEAGITIEKGTRVTIPVLGLHRDPDYFPDPERFDPERFSDKNRTNIPQYCYLPFGEGARICIGARFGQMQAKVGLALLVKNFAFSVNNRTPDPLQMHPMNFILTTKTGLWLDVKRVC